MPLPPWWPKKIFFNFYNDFIVKTVHTKTAVQANGKTLLKNLEPSFIKYTFWVALKEKSKLQWATVFS